MATVATQVRLWYWQRISALVLALCVLVHLSIMIFAVRGGLSAAEILGRTQGSWAFGIFYGAFVLATAVHVPIGMAKILEETMPWSSVTITTITRLFGLVILVAGLRAVFGVVAT